MATERLPRACAGSWSPTRHAPAPTRSTRRCASAIFAVLVNGEEVACTAPMAPGDAAQVIEAALPAEGDAIEIKLQTRLPEGASGDNCFTVWGSPRLVK